MSGEARADIVNSFLLGSIRSQRAMTTDGTATDAQINGYCNCIAPALGSLTYKQIRMSNAAEYIRRAVETVAIVPNESLSPEKPRSCQAVLHSLAATDVVVLLSVDCTRVLCGNCASGGHPNLGLVLFENLSPHEYKARSVVG